MRHNIAVISQYYSPEPTPIPEDVALFLIGNGHSVEVFTSFPQYPKGALYPGYENKQKSVENLRGIKVNRLRSVIPTKQNFLFRLLSFISFNLSMLTAIKKIASFDVLYVYGSPLTNAFVPKLIKIFGGPSYVIHAVDVWPESLYSELSKIRKPYLRKFASQLILKLSSGLYKTSSAVIAVTKQNYEIFVRRLPHTKVVLIFNSAPMDFENIGKQQKPRTKNTVPQICYGGNLGKMQDLGVLIEAVSFANSQGAIFQLVIAGDGIESTTLRDKVSSSGITNIVFKGRISSLEMIDLYSNSDFGVATLLDEPIFSGSVPSKIPAMMALGLPIISNIRGETRELIEDNKIGFSVKPSDSSCLGAAIVEAVLIRDDDWRKLSNRTRETYFAKMSRRKSLELIEQILINSVKA